MRNLVENCQFDPKWLFGQNRPIWSKMTNLVKNCNSVKNDHFQKVTFGQKGSNGGHERSNHLQILVLSRCCTWKRKHPLEVASEIRLIHKCRIQILFWDVIIIHWSISFSQSAHSTVHHTGRAQAQASPERFINLKVIWGHLGSSRVISGDWRGQNLVRKLTWYGMKLVILQVYGHVIDFCGW